MENSKRYHKDNRNAAFALVTFLGSLTAMMWIAFPDHADIHSKYTMAVVPLLVVMLGIGIHQHWKMKRTR